MVEVVKVLTSTILHNLHQPPPTFGEAYAV
jgi:hypothetical protein